MSICQHNETGKLHTGYVSMHVIYANYYLQNPTELSYTGLGYYNTPSVIGKIIIINKFCILRFEI